MGAVRGNRSTVKLATVPAQQMHLLGETLDTIRSAEYCLLLDQRAPRSKTARVANVIRA